MSVAWLVRDERRTPMPTGWGPLTGHREQDWWSWNLLDRQDRVVRQLDGVEGGSLDINVNADTQGTGSLSWSGQHHEMPVWRGSRVQPVYNALLSDGSVAQWPMGVYLCHSPGITHNPRGFRKAEISLHDKTLILRRAKLTEKYAVKKGTQVVPRVRALLNTYGVGRHVIEDSTATLRTTLVWEAGEEIMQVINDLLRAIDYFSIHADENGLLRASSYTHPNERPYVWTFTDQDGLAIHEEDITHDEDDFDVPNRVTVTSRGDDYTFELKSTVTLDSIDPGHPWSYQVTKEWVDRHEDGVDIANQAALDKYARRLLVEGLSVTSKATLVHAPMPLRGHDRVEVDTSGLVMPSATVQSIGIECEPGADWSTQVREVAL